MIQSEAAHHRRLSAVTAAVFKEITKNATWPETRAVIEPACAAQHLPVRETPG
jgi:hypothetical protein